MGYFLIFLVLSAISLLSLLWFPSRFWHFRARQFAIAGFTHYRSVPRIPWAAGSMQRTKRPVRQITLADFGRLLEANSQGLVVLDLRPDAHWVPFPVRAAYVLRIRPEELPEILAWLPASQSVVFYGARDPWVSVIEKSASKSGSAPFYLLDADLTVWHAA